MSNIMSGLKIPFRCMPYQKYLQIVLDNELLKKGALCQLPFTEEAFYSLLFLVHKKGGSMPPIINLDASKQFIENPHFQMEHC